MKEEIDTLVESLLINDRERVYDGKEEPVKPRRAIEKLVRTKGVVPALIRLIERYEKEKEGRYYIEYVIEILGRIGGDQPSELILRVLHTSVEAETDSDDSIMLCVRWLRRLDKAAVPHITKFVDQNYDNTPFVMSAAEALEGIRDRRLVPLLLRMLTYPNPLVIQSALVSLKKQGDRSTVSQITPLLEYRDSMPAEQREVRNLAQGALTSLLRGGQGAHLDRSGFALRTRRRERRGARTSWDLGWRRYVSKSDIVADANLVTFIAGYGETDDSASAYKSLLSWLQEKGYTIESKASNRAIREAATTAASLRMGHILFLDDNGWMPIRCTVGRSHDDILAFLRRPGAEEPTFVGEIEHGIRHKIIAGLGVLTIRVGAVDSEGVDLYPYKFLELRKGKRLVAKMLVGHFNYEMSERAPTMELLEVVPDERRKGIATRMVGFIETEAEKEGFDRVWGTDAERSYELLSKLGYEYDLEECVKHF